MAFLAPLFLAALAALAIPVILHLAHRERRRPVPFPSLAFVRRVPFRTRERRRIRNWLLLLLRVAAVALLAVAFARPFFQRGAVGTAGVNAAREILVVLDRSVSMGYGDRWARAVAAARSAVGGLGPDDRAGLILFDERPEVAAASAADRTAFEGALALARPDGAGTRYAPALQLAGDLIEQSQLPRRLVVFLTDFQRAAWDGRADLRLPGGTELQWVDVGDDRAENRTVAGVAIQRSSSEGGRVTVTARVANLGTREADVKVRFGTREQTLQERTVRVGAAEATPVAFDPIALPPTPTTAWVALDADRLPADDRFDFVLRPIPTIPLLLVEPRGAPDRETIYLRRALALGQDPAFGVTVRAGGAAPAELRGQAVVILNDVPFPSGETGRALAAFVEAGGGLLWAGGARAGALPPSAREAFGGAAGTPADRLSDRGGSMAVADYGHPVFQPFRESRGGDFSSVRVFRYRRLDPPDSAAVLAWMDDGGPLLADVRWGAGHALLWGSDLANNWNDLPLRAVFLPMVHEAVRYLAHHREAPASYAVGQTIALADLELPSDTALVLEAPDGSRTALDVADGQAHLPLRQGGVYQIRALRGSRPAVPIAVNVNPEESDLTTLDREALLAAVAAPPGAEGQAGAANLTAAERERRQRLWWFLALGAFVALAGETVVTAVRPHRATV